MGFLRFTFIDLIDIVVIGVLVYYFLRYIKGTRALQMMGGLIILFVTAFIAEFLSLQGFSWIMTAFKTAWIVAFVILFQPEIRSALASIGKTRFLRAFIREEEIIITEIANGAIELSEKGIGGLIVIEREVGLKNYVDTGISLDAKVKSDLITTIFTPYSPLHDGAVIIRSSTIVAASCILPLSDNPELPHTMGTRHRAALGIAEESDAVAIVISEETRKISLAYNRNLRTNITRENLKGELKRLL